MHRRAMGFTEATDILVGNVNHQRIADAAGVSVQSVRQARLDSRNPNHRSPPNGWEAVLARLALTRCKELKALANERSANKSIERCLTEELSLQALHFLNPYSGDTGKRTRSTLHALKKTSSVAFSQPPKFARAN